MSKRLRVASLFVASNLVLAVGVASCGGSSDEASASPCAEELAELCGDACDGDADCPMGTHCGGDGRCTAQCTPDGGQCKGGQICDPRGRCVTGISTGKDGGGGDACIDVDVTFEKKTPTVVLLIDQSGSMTESFGGGNRWNVLRNALMDPQTGIVQSLQDEVRFGLALYTSKDGNAGGQCPIITGVPIALGNYQAINAVYSQASPEDETPTGESIDAVVQELAPYPEPGPKVIVLATDGEPDTCAQPNPQNGQQVAIQAAQNAYNQGIQTYIISVGQGSVSLSHLQDMANAGKGVSVGGSTNAKYYEANDQPALKQAFDEIINGVRSCILTLDGQVDPSEVNQGTVLLDGMPLGFNDPDGWKFNPPNEIELLGQACQTIKQGDHTLNIDFPCGVYQPPPQ